MLVQVLTQEKAAIKIQAGVRGLLTRLQVHRTAQEELQFIGMKPKVVYYSTYMLHIDGPCAVTCICLCERPRETYVCVAQAASQVVYMVVQTSQQRAVCSTLCAGSVHP